MKKVLLLVLAIILSLCITSACYGDKANRDDTISSEQEQTGNTQLLNPLANPTSYEDTSTAPWPIRIELPNAKWAEGMEGEIINNTEIVYKYEDNHLCCE